MSFLARRVCLRVIRMNVDNSACPSDDELLEAALTALMWLSSIDVDGAPACLALRGLFGGGLCSGASVSADMASLLTYAADARVKLELSARRSIVEAIVCAIQAIDTALREKETTDVEVGGGGGGGGGGGKEVVGLGFGVELAASLACALASEPVLLVPRASRFCARTVAANWLYRAVVEGGVCVASATIAPLATALYAAAMRGGGALNYVTAPPLRPLDAATEAALDAQTGPPQTLPTPPPPHPHPTAADQTVAAEQTAAAAPLQASPRSSSFVGLHNEKAATCFLNSILAVLFWASGETRLAVLAGADAGAGAGAGAATGAGMEVDSVVDDRLSLIKSECAAATSAAASLFAALASPLSAAAPRDKTLVADTRPLLAALASPLRTASGDATYNVYAQNDAYQVLSLIGNVIPGAALGVVLRSVKRCTACGVSSGGVDLVGAAALDALAVQAPRAGGPGAPVRLAEALSSELNGTEALKDARCDACGQVGFLFRAAVLLNRLAPLLSVQIKRLTVPEAESVMGGAENIKSPSSQEPPPLFVTTTSTTPTTTSPPSPTYSPGPVATEARGVVEIPDLLTLTPPQWALAAVGVGGVDTDADSDAATHTDYTLVAVVTHTSLSLDAGPTILPDSATCGHYIAYVRNVAGGGGWLRCDDGAVTSWNDSTAARVRTWWGAPKPLPLGEACEVATIAFYAPVGGDVKANSSAVAAAAAAAAVDAAAATIDRFGRAQAAALATRVLLHAPGAAQAAAAALFIALHMPTAAAGEMAAAAVALAAPLAVLESTAKANITTCTTEDLLIGTLNAPNGAALRLALARWLTTPPDCGDTAPIAWEGLRGGVRVRIAERISKLVVAVLDSASTPIAGVKRTHVAAEKGGNNVDGAADFAASSAASAAATSTIVTAILSLMRAGHASVARFARLLCFARVSLGSAKAILDEGALAFGCARYLSAAARAGAPWVAALPQRERAALEHVLGRATTTATATTTAAAIATATTIVAAKAEASELLVGIIIPLVLSRRVRELHLACVDDGVPRAGDSRTAPPSPHSTSSTCSGVVIAGECPACGGARTSSPLLLVEHAARALLLRPAVLAAITNDYGVPRKLRASFLSHVAHGNPQLSRRVGAALASLPTALASGGAVAPLDSVRAILDRMYLVQAVTDPKNDTDGCGALRLEGLLFHIDWRTTEASSGGAAVADTALPVTVSRVALAECARVEPWLERALARGGKCGGGEGGGEVTVHARGVIAAATHAAQSLYNTRGLDWALGVRRGDEASFLATARYMARANIARAALEKSGTFSDQAAAKVAAGAAAEEAAAEAATDLSVAIAACSAATAAAAVAPPRPAQMLHPIISIRTCFWLLQCLTVSRARASDDPALDAVLSAASFVGGAPTANILLQAAVDRLVPPLVALRFSPGALPPPLFALVDATLNALLSEARRVVPRVLGPALDTVTRVYLKNMYPISLPLNGALCVVSAAAVAAYKVCYARLTDVADRVARAFSNMQPLRSLSVTRCDVDYEFSSETEGETGEGETQMTTFRPILDDLRAASCQVRNWILSALPPAVEARPAPVIVSADMATSLGAFIATALHNGSIELRQKELVGGNVSGAARHYWRCAALLLLEGDPVAALNNAQRLTKFQKELTDALLFLMNDPESLPAEITRGLTPFKNITRLQIETCFAAEGVPDACLAGEGGFDAFDTAVCESFKIESETLLKQLADQLMAIDDADFAAQKPST